MNDAEAGVEATAPQTLIERARGLGTMLRERAAEVESDRRISNEVIAAIREREIFRILQPRMFGGFEHDWEVMIAVSFEIAAACGSTGWVTSLGIGHQWFVSKFPIEAQHDVWGDDLDAITFGSYAPINSAKPIDGGYRVNGRGRFASGCDHGSWALLGVALPPEPGHEKPSPGFVLIPAADYEIEDDWHTMGLAGTGSKTIVCSDVFVPSHRVLAFSAAADGATPGSTFHANPLYGLPLLTCIPMCICVPTLGMLHGAIEEFRDSMYNRESRGSLVPDPREPADYAAVQTHFAEATASLDAARLLIGRDMAEARQFAESGRILSTETRIRNRRDQAFAVRLAVNGINGLFDAGGALGIYLDNHNQRAWREINAAARHIAFNWGAVSTMYGQNAFDRPIMASIGY